MNQSVPTKTVGVRIATAAQAVTAGSDLEQLKRLSLGWLIRQGVSLSEAEDLFQQSILKALPACV